MREENDQRNSVESCGDESKAHQCSVENWEEEDPVLKITETGKNNDDVSELFYDTRSGDEWDKSSNDGKSTCGDSNEAGEKVRETSHGFAANEDSAEKVDPVFFMDKSVTVCDSPEMVVCYKENAYHVVKDICVDEGVPVQEKFLFGDKDSVKCSSEDLLKSDKTNVTMSEDDRSSKVDDSDVCNDHTTDQNVKEESSKEDFADAIEGSSDCNQEGLIVTGEVKDFPTQDVSREIESEEKSKCEVLTLGDILTREDDEEKPLSVIVNNSNRPEEEQSPPYLVQEREQRSLETTHLKTELEKTEEPNRGDSHEDDKLYSNRFGETSFSASEAVSISGHITYSGPIAFSGSLSVRSDASTTSGRSFAFPILQSEWNSSPVRMAKADKRRHKGWRHTLLCCRFSLGAQRKN